MYIMVTINVYSSRCLNMQALIDPPCIIPILAMQVYIYIRRSWINLLEHQGHSEHPAVVCCVDVE